MQLCTFSKSAVHAASILPECPLALSGAIAKKCPCRKRIYVDDLRLLSCTHPTTWRGEMIRDSDALAASLKRKHDEKKQGRKREKELENWEMSTTTESPAKGSANGATHAGNGMTTANANGSATHKPDANAGASLILGGPSPTAMAFYRRIADPMDAVNKLGLMFSRSRMFGCNNEDQGRVLAMICLTEGRTPSSLLKQHHIIGGKLSDKADAMLAMYRLRGGKHNIKKYTPDVVQIEFTTADQKYTGSFTWAEAQEEDYIYTSDANNGKVAKKLKDGTVNRGALKDNWSTPRRRAQMMWARVVSDSIRHLMPEVNFGEYTADELGGNETFDGEDAYVDAEFEVKLPAEAVETEEVVDVKVSEQTFDRMMGLRTRIGMNEVKWQAILDAHSDGQLPAYEHEALSIIKQLENYSTPATATPAEAVNIPTEAAHRPAAPATPPPAADGTTTHLQVDPNPNSDADCIIDVPRLTELGKLKEAIGYTREEWNEKVLAKFGVTTARALTRGMADLLIPKLQEKLKKMQQRDELSKWADPRPEVPSEDVVKN